jgi:hypothetical protein
MARKNKNNNETEISDIIANVEEPVVDIPLPVQDEPEIQQPAAIKPAQPVQKPPVPPKKRIRIRPSQKKKLSVAVLCTNPLTRRFI